MINGIYTSAAGAKVQMAGSDITANNLANLSTTGFKKQLAIMRQRSPETIEQGVSPSLLDPLYEKTGGGIALSEAATDFSEGSIYHTGGRFQAAIDGKGFFPVTDGNEIYYTRSGDFVPGPNNTLVSLNGKYTLLSNNESVNNTFNLGNYESLEEYSQDGGILNLYGFRKPDELTHVGEAVFSDKGEAGLVTPQDPQGVDIGDYRVGYLEKSNVNPVTELTNMIRGYRAYEANMKALSSHDQILNRTVNDVGRIR